MTSPLDYVARGWWIFPCHSIRRGQCTCQLGISCQDSGKHPLTTKGFQDASKDPNVVRAWMDRWPFANWALATGHINGLITIDIDPRNGGFDSFEQYEEARPDGPLPGTLRSFTGGGGSHLFFGYPPDATIKGSQSKWMPGVDIKSDGGYVILPEAEHKTGGRYKWINWHDQPVWLPADVVFDLTQLSTRGSSLGSTSDLPSTSEILAGVPEGERDSTLFREACRLRRQLGDGARRAVEILILEAARNCSPPFPDDVALRKVEQAWQQDHSDLLVDLVWPQQSPSTNGSEPHALTDLGNAKRLLDQYGNDMLYVEGWGWLVWTDIGWQRDSRGDIAERTHKLSELIIDEARQMENDGVTDPKKIIEYIKWANRSQSAATMNNSLEVVQDMTQIRQPAVAFDSVDHELVCRNGVVDLRTGQLRPIDRNDLVTKNTGVVYDPSYRLDEWERFIWECCNGDQETINYLQRSLGYSLTGDTKEEALWLIGGPPASGKSTFLDGVHAAMGSYATTTQSDTFMWVRGQSAPPHELARLAGVRLVSLAEIKEGASFDENLIKQVTGGDRVTARFLYQGAFEFRPQFAIWIGTNHDPQAHDDALWRRIKKIKFPNAIPPEKRDLSLKALLRDPNRGGRAVLAWAVRGAMEWYAGGLRQPHAVTAAVWEYHAEQDHIQQFIDECIQPAQGVQVLLKEAYSTYRIWCVNTGQRTKPRPIFEKMMRGKGFQTIMSENDGQMVYPNIRVKDALSFINSNMYS